MEETFDKDKVLRYTRILLEEDRKQGADKNSMDIDWQMSLIEQEVLPLPQNEWPAKARELADKGVLIGLFLDACRESGYDDDTWSDIEDACIMALDRNRDAVDHSGLSDDEVLNYAKDLLEPFNQAMLRLRYQSAIGIADGDLESAFLDILKAWFESRIKNYPYGF